MEDACGMWGGAGGGQIQAGEGRRRGCGGRALGGERRVWHVVFSQIAQIARRDQMAYWLPTFSSMRSQLRAQLRACISALLLLSLLRLLLHLGPSESATKARLLTRVDDLGVRMRGSATVAKREGPHPGLHGCHY